MSAQEASSPYSKLSPIETNENKQNDIEAVGEEPAEPSNAADPVIGAKTIEKKHATLAQVRSVYVVCCRYMNVQLISTLLLSL
ncbi:hypothetical protein EON64_00315 [archaeon]|nr:MAG: hypothetical protein EON64_00315 [archaeon]